MVFIIYYFFRNKYSIFVISGNRKLRNFNLTLLYIYNSLKVVSNLIDSISSFFLGKNLTFITFFNVSILWFNIAYMFLKLLNLLLKFFFIFFHFCSALSFLDKSIELIFIQASNIISLEIKSLSFLFFFKSFFYSQLINFAEWIEIDYSSRKLLFSRISFSRNNCFLGFSCSNKS